MLVAVLAGLDLGPGSAAQEPAAHADPADVGVRLETLRAEADLPALGAARVTLDGLDGVWVTGTRRADGPEKVEPGDLWHLGSCTKAMTATLIALLVERGDLAWDSPIGEFLPELAVDLDDAFLDLTLVELLNHRAGLVANPPELPGLRLDGSDVVEQRERITRSLLTQPPLHAPGQGFLYSNAGFMVAGHVAERVTGQSWEHLMRTLLFEPLGMTSAGFGPPGTPGTCDQPRGHGDDGTPLEPGPQADNPPAIGPAGTVHASLEDWGRFIRLHLAGARGDVRVGDITLKQATFTRLHTALDGPGQRYAFGWVVEQRPWAGGDGRALWHNGSNTLWYCVTWLGLDNGVAVLVTTNRAASASGPVDRAAQLLIEDWQQRASPGAAR